MASVSQFPTIPSAEEQAVEEGFDFFDVLDFFNLASLASVAPAIFLKSGRKALRNPEDVSFFLPRRGTSVKATDALPQQVRGRLKSIEGRRAAKERQLTRVNALARELGLSPSQLDEQLESSANLLRAIGQSANNLIGSQKRSFPQNFKRAQEIMGVPDAEVERARRIVDAFGSEGVFSRGGAEPLSSIEKGIREVDDLDTLARELMQVLGAK